MPKLLNGKINDSGVIVPLNDATDIFHSRVENSLLYRQYESGKVKAKIELAEFDDGQVACSSDVMTSYSGYGIPMTMSDKMDRETAIQKGKDRIIKFLKNVIADKSSSKAKLTDGDCKKVLEQIYYDMPVFKRSGKNEKNEEPLTLPLNF